MYDTPPEAKETAASTFFGGSVVQVVAAERGLPIEAVPVVQDVTVTLLDGVIVARKDELEWLWPLEDLAAVHHGPDEPWSIFEVPGVTEYGVAVRERDVTSFRLQLDALRRLADADLAHLDAHLDVDPDHGEPDVPRAFEVGRPWAEPPREDDVTRELHLDPVVREGMAGTDMADRRRLVPNLGSFRTRLRQRPGGRTNGLPQSPGLAGLEARNISAWFGDHMVLDRVSLEMAAGQVTALIGPSGCGKSTFLRILNRMHELIPSASLAGEVLLDGVDVYDPSRRLTDARREIGMVFQKPNPFPAMSIYDNVIASLRLTGTKVDQETKDELVESCLMKAGLWKEVRDRLRQPGGGLSGGQQQRLCIARALAITPRVLLMDEPCSALDPTSTRRIEETIFELVSELTIVIVTHNMQQALRVSNSCAFFLAEQGTPGVIVEHGPTDAMFHRPQDQRTDDYVNGRFG